MEHWHDDDGDAAFYASRQQHAQAINRARIVAADAARGIRHHDIVCHYWLKDRCGAGDRCPYLHVLVEHKIQLCQYYAKRVACPDGATCIFRHYFLDDREEAKCLTAASAKAGKSS